MCAILALGKRWEDGEFKASLGYLSGEEEPRINSWFFPVLPRNLEKSLNFVFEVGLQGQKGIFCGMVCQCDSQVLDI